MKTRFLPVLFCFYAYMVAGAQGVAINETGAKPDTSAVLDISNTHKGILIPRLTTSERNAIHQPATALLIFNSQLMQFQVNTGIPDAPVWKNIVSMDTAMPSQPTWSTKGNNSLGDSAFIGTTDAKSFVVKTNNLLRIYIDSLSGRVGIATNEPRAALDIQATDAMVVPVGTTEQRPATPVIGMIRFNATSGKLEGFTSGGWVALH